ncbi:MAG: dienelactone hydrolase family protein [Anaerolineae bacterium]
MKKTIGMLIGIGLLLLSGCATSAPPPTATPVPTATAVPVPPTSTPTFVPPTPAFTVEVTKDVEYVTLLQPGAPVQKLDVYSPTELGPWPVVVLMHAWFQSKDNAIYASLAEELAGRGVVVFVPQRRSESATLFEYAQDNGRDIREVHESWACAVRFVRESAADYGGDPGRVTVLGHGSTGLDTAFIGDDLQQVWEEVASLRGGPPPQTDCLAGGDSAHVEAYIGYGGDYHYYKLLRDSDPELWELTSPFGLIGRNPSLLVHLVHGEMGNPAYIERAVEYREDLVNAGYDATLTLLGDADWQIPFSGPDREALIQVILEVAHR